MSYYTPEQFSIYRTAEEKASIRSRVLAVQNQFDILQGEVYMPADVLAYAARTGISFVAWSPLARGLLTERYLDLEAVGPGDRLYDEGALEGLATEEMLARLLQLAALAQAWGCELSQLAIAYMLTLPGMGPVIDSASSVEQVASNAALGGSSGST